MVKIEKNYGYMGPGDGDKRYYMTEGQYMSGITVGFMVLEARVPFFPGNLSNAYTYDFPVRFLKVEGATQEKIHRGDRSLIDDYIRTAKQLEIDGCRVIFGQCGYCGHFQKELAEAIDTPVYMSSMIQAPWIFTGLKKSEKLGVMCADSKNLTWSLFEACGCTREHYERSVIYGAENGPEFKKLMGDVGNLHTGLLREEIVGLADKMVAENPDLGAILMECSDMPPYAAEIQRRHNLPVFDFTTLINYVHSAVARKPFYGFM